MVCCFGLEDHGPSSCESGSLSNTRRTYCVCAKVGVRGEKSLNGVFQKLFSGEVAVEKILSSMHTFQLDSDMLGFILSTVYKYLWYKNT